MTMPTPTPPARAQRLRLRLRLAAALATMTACAVVRAADIIHTEPSQFSPVVVYEEVGQRCITFGSLRAVGRQTCLELAQPQKMVFDYTRMMMAALFVQPDARRVLIIGLGGGTLPKALAQVLPQATIDTVEIDPAVIRVAERFFDYRPGERQRVFVADGREFVETARREQRQYDLVMLDAFDIDYIPQHLLTREFLQQVRAILAPGGVLAANTFTGSQLYPRESATYAHVFGDFFNLRAGNRVILARNGPLPDAGQLQRNAQTLAGALAPYGIDVARELQRFSRERDWPDDAPILTD